MQIFQLNIHKWQPETDFHCYIVFLAATKQLFEWFGPSICYTFFTMFPL